MPQSSQNPNLASVKDITAALASLKFEPPTLDTLVAIAVHCREPFLEALSACVAGRDEEGRNSLRLRSILQCTSPAAVRAVRDAGCQLPVAEMALLGVKCPKRFLSILDAVRDKTHPRQSEALEELARLAASPPSRNLSPAAPANEAPPASAPGARQDAPPAPARERIGASMPAQSAPQAKPKDWRSVHVYGSKFALCFNAVTGQDGVPGVMVDAAVVTTQPRVYDWKNAIHIMLDVREVGAVLAVFRRWRRAAEFAAHGRMNDKAFSIEQQSGHVYCKVSAKVDGGQGMRAVQIQPLDVTKVALLFTEQLLLAHPGLPASEVLATIRAAHSEGAPQVQAAA